MAKTLNKALVIHTRDSVTQAIDHLDVRWAPGAPRLPLLVGRHGRAVERALGFGALISFAGNVSFKSAGNLREAAVAVPGERLLVETDSPFLSPAPHRGQPNEPAHAWRWSARRLQRRATCPWPISRRLRPRTRGGSSALPERRACWGPRASRQLFDGSRDPPDEVARAELRDRPEHDPQGPGCSRRGTEGSRSRDRPGGRVVDRWARRACRVGRRDRDRHATRPVLEETLGDLTNVELVFADAMKADLDTWKATKMVANLPYNIAVQVVMRALETAPTVTEFIVMTQREVGERMAAAPGSKTYGLPSVLIRYYAGARVVGAIARRAFHPVPNVDSVLVKLTRQEPPDVDRALLFDLARACFGQRRKSIRNGLAPVLGPRTDEIISRAGLDPKIRPERLDLDAFAQLARAATT